MILFLDKDPVKAAVVFNRMSEADQRNTIWCMTRLEAQITLWDYKEVLTKAYLEHDLGEQSYANTRSEDSGMELVRFLEGIEKNKPTEFEAFKKIEFIIQTHNEFAGPRMLERLTKIGLNVSWVPFGMEKR